MLLHMQQQAAGGRHGHRLTRMTYQRSDSVTRRLEEQSCQILSRSYLKWRSLRPFLNRVTSRRTRTTIRWVAIWDQLLIDKEIQKKKYSNGRFYNNWTKTEATQVVQRRQKRSVAYVQPEATRHKPKHSKVHQRRKVTYQKTWHNSATTLQTSLISSWKQ